MSSSPLPYWIAALLTSSPDTKPVPLVNPEKPATVTSGALLKVETKENLEHAWRNAATEERISRGNRDPIQLNIFGLKTIRVVESQFSYKSCCPQDTEPNRNLK